MGLSTKRYNRYQKEKKSLKGSFKHAYNGLKYAYYAENHIRSHIMMAFLAIFMAYFLDISKIEWLIIIASIFFVITLELINTSIEVIIDMIEPNLNPLAGLVKDISAGAVLLGAILALINGFVIFAPKILYVIEVLFYVWRT